MSYMPSHPWGLNAPLAELNSLFRVWLNSAVIITVLHTTQPSAV